MQRIERTASGLNVVQNELVRPKNRQVDLYDTTLRDGQQRRDVGYTPGGKVRVANAINATLPVAIIEGGWPGANPTDTEFFRRSLNEPYADKLAAFGMTRRAGSHVESDTNIANLLDSGAPIITLVGKSDTLHVERVFHTTHEENIAMIEDSVRYAREQGRRVVYDAEHFFDGARRNPEYAMETLYAAARGGAEAVVLCDTNGGRMPWEIEEWVKRVMDDSQLHQLYREAYGINHEDESEKIQVGIHTHADKRMAEANALLAVRAGVTHVQGTVAGLGERAGNANILVIADELDNQGLVPMTDEQRARFVALSDTVYDASGAAKDPYSPLIGENVFATTAGMHQDATLKTPDAYAHRPPADYGNELKIFISSQSGRKAVADRARQLGLDIPAERIPGIMTEIKQREFEGLRFSRAEASLDLLMRRHEPSYSVPFSLQPKDDAIQVTRVHNEDVIIPMETRTSAVFESVKTALTDAYPQLDTCSFESERIEQENGTKRVFVKTSNNEKTWVTVGVGSTMKEAVVKAISDALEYGIYHHTNETHS